MAILIDRFPENEVQDWSAFDCEAIAQCNFNFGVEQINSLCSKYKDLLGLNEISVLVQQFNDYKFAVAEKIKSKLVSNYPDMVAYAL